MIIRCGLLSAPRSAQHARPERGGRPEPGLHPDCDSVPTARRCRCRACPAPTMTAAPTTWITAPQAEITARRHSTRASAPARASVLHPTQERRTATAPVSDGDGSRSSARSGATSIVLAAARMASIHLSPTAISNRLPKGVDCRACLSVALSNTAVRGGGSPCCSPTHGEAPSVGTAHGLRAYSSLCTWATHLKLRRPEAGSATELPLEIEAVQSHDLGPSLRKIFQERFLPVVSRVELRDHTQLGV